MDCREGIIDLLQRKLMRDVRLDLPFCPEANHLTSRLRQQLWIPFRMSSPIQPTERHILHQKYIGRDFRNFTTSKTDNNSSPIPIQGSDTCFKKLTTNSINKDIDPTWGDDERYGGGMKEGQDSLAPAASLSFERKNFPSHPE
jgi:hypothetical protein